MKKGKSSNISKIAKNQFLKKDSIVAQAFVSLEKTGTTKFSTF